MAAEIAGAAWCIRWHASPSASTAMKTVDRYLLLATLRPLAVSLTIALLALLLERLVMLFDLVAGRGGSSMLVLNMLIKLLPHFLGLAAPAAFFAGIVLATMRLSTVNEIDVFQALGVGPYRLLAPIMVPAVLLMTGLALIFGFVRPYASYEYKVLVHNVTHSALTNALERGVFFSGFGGFTTVVDSVQGDRHYF